MKTTKLTIALMTSLLPLACGQVETSARSAAGTSAEITDSEESANQLFLSDLTEASASTETTEEAASESVDESVQEDVKPGRLEQMASMIFNELDLDASGSLSLDEFLAGPTKFAEDKNFDEEKKTRIIAKMTSDFETYAGDDKVLSSDELKTLLSKVAKRVGQHRAKNHGGRHKDRVKQNWDEIAGKYDADKDGKLSKAEFETMHADRKEEHKKIKQRGISNYARKLGYSK
jgi:hypothetical protein